MHCVIGKNKEINYEYRYSKINYLQQYPPSNPFYLKGTNKD